MQVLPWLEANCCLVLERIQAEEEDSVKRSRENRKLRYQGLPRNIHRFHRFLQYLLKKIPLILLH